MKFQIPNIHHSKKRRYTRTHRQTDRQAQTNMPFQLFQSWGHNKSSSRYNIAAFMLNRQFTFTLEAATKIWQIVHCFLQSIYQNFIHLTVP